MDDFDIHRAAALPEQMVAKYWSDIAGADLLKHRLSNLKEPNIRDLAESLGKQKRYMFYVLHYREGQYLKIVGEFTLLPFRGNSSIIHFSLHPDNRFKFNIGLSRYVTERLLTYTGGPDDELRIESLLGFTPLPNRQARLFIQRAGFRKIATIPGAGYHEGEVCDAVMSIKTIEDCHG